jgi:hypothetical protein
MLAVEEAELILVQQEQVEQVEAEQVVMALHLLQHQEQQELAAVEEAVIELAKFVSLLATVVQVS